MELLAVPLMLAAPVALTAHVVLPVSVGNRFKKFLASPHKLVVVRNDAGNKLVAETTTAKMFPEILHTAAKLNNVST